MATSRYGHIDPMTRLAAMLSDRQRQFEENDDKLVRVKFARTDAQGKSYVPLYGKTSTVPIPLPLSSHENISGYMAAYAHAMTSLKGAYRLLYKIMQEEAEDIENISSQYDHKGGYETLFGGGEGFDETVDFLNKVRNSAIYITNFTKCTRYLSNEHVTGRTGDFRDYVNVMLTVVQINMMSYLSLPSFDFIFDAFVKGSKVRARQDNTYSRPINVVIRCIYKKVWGKVPENLFSTWNCLYDASTETVRSIIDDPGNNLLKIFRGLNSVLEALDVRVSQVFEKPSGKDILKWLQTQMQDAINTYIPDKVAEAMRTWDHAIAGVEDEIIQHVSKFTKEDAPKENVYAGDELDEGDVPAVTGLEGDTIGRDLANLCDEGEPRQLFLRAAGMIMLQLKYRLAQSVDAKRNELSLVGTNIYEFHKFAQVMQNTVLPRVVGDADKQTMRAHIFAILRSGVVDSDLDRFLQGLLDQGWNDHRNILMLECFKQVLRCVLSQLHSVGTDNPVEVKPSEAMQAADQALDQLVADEVMGGDVSQVARERMLAVVADTRIKLGSLTHLDGAYADEVVATLRDKFQGFKAGRNALPPEANESFWFPSFHANMPDWPSFINRTVRLAAAGTVQIGGRTIALAPLRAAGGARSLTNQEIAQLETLSDTTEAHRHILERVFKLQDAISENPQHADHITTALMDLRTAMGIRLGTEDQEGARDHALIEHNMIGEFSRVSFRIGENDEGSLMSSILIAFIEGLFIDTKLYLLRYTLFRNQNVFADVDWLETTIMNVRLGYSRINVPTMARYIQGFDDVFKGRLAPFYFLLMCPEYQLNLRRYYTDATLRGQKLLVPVQAYSIAFKKFSRPGDAEPRGAAGTDIEELFSSTRKRDGTPLKLQRIRHGANNEDTLQTHLLVDFLESRKLDNPQTSQRRMAAAHMHSSLQQATHVVSLFSNVILAWIAHLERTVNSDMSRVTESVYDTNMMKQDWSMLDITKIREGDGSGTKFLDIMDEGISTNWQERSFDCTRHIFFFDYNCETILGLVNQTDALVGKLAEASSEIMVRAFNPNEPRFDPNIDKAFVTPLEEYIEAVCKQFPGIQFIFAYPAEEANTGKHKEEVRLKDDYIMRQTTAIAAGLDKLPSQVQIPLNFTVPKTTSALEKVTFIPQRNMKWAVRANALHRAVLIGVSEDAASSEETFSYVTQDTGVGIVSRAWKKNPERELKAYESRHQKQEFARISLDAVKFPPSAVPMFESPWYKAREAKIKQAIRNTGDNNYGDAFPRYSRKSLFPGSKRKADEALDQAYKSAREF